MCKFRFLFITFFLSFATLAFDTPTFDNVLDALNYNNEVLDWLWTSINNEGTGSGHDGWAHGTIGDQVVEESRTLQRQNYAIYLSYSNSFDQLNQELRTQTQTIAQFSSHLDGLTNGVLEANRQRQEIKDGLDDSNRRY